MRICIVGGGAIGAVASRYLADKGHSVTLVEQDNKLCAGTSGGNASLLCFDGSISIFRERADWKSMLTIATRYPRWAVNYLFSFPKEHTFIERQRKLLHESSKIFHVMVPDDYNYGELVKYSDGSIKPNSYQVYTPDFVNRLVIHPNISIKLNSHVTDIITDSGRVTAIKTASGETIHADVFVLCRNRNEGPIMIVPVYGQTLVRKSDRSPCAIIDSAKHMVYNVMNGEERVSHGAIVRSNVDEAIRDLNIPEISGQWDEILTNARPVSPDSLPIICKDRTLSNLFYSGGHGFIGWSLSFVSARILDDVINDKTTEFTDWVRDRFF
jgi:glycine/D-amino acid oxidase-like deaminating enzyme